MAFNAFSEGATNPSNDFQPQLTTEPTAPGEDVMCQNNLRTGDDFIIIDYKPTESLKVDPSDPSVDPNNPNADARPGSAHVAISLGDGKAIEAAGDDHGISEWSDPAQLDGGTNMSPWTVTHSGNRANPETFDCSELTQWASGTAQEGDVPKGDWITDVTYQSVELLGQPATETLTIAHEGFLR